MCQRPPIRPLSVPPSRQSTCLACQAEAGRRLSPHCDVNTRRQYQHRIQPGSRDVTSCSQPQPDRSAWNPDVTIPDLDKVQVYLWNAERHTLAANESSRMVPGMRDVTDHAANQSPGTSWNCSSLASGPITRSETGPLGCVTCLSANP